MKKKAQDEKTKEQILKNIDSDRNESIGFLNNIKDFIFKNEGSYSGEEYSKIMMSAAKILEALSKSNEQVVRLHEIQTKQKIDQDLDLNTEDIEDLYSEKRKEVVET